MSLFNTIYATGLQRLTLLSPFTNGYLHMNNINENKTSGTSRQVSNKMSLRYVKEDLDEILTDLYNVRKQLENGDLTNMLDDAWGNIETVLREIEDREDKVEELIKSIAE